MFLSKYKSAAALLVTVGVLGTGAATMTGFGFGEVEEQQPEKKPEQVRKTNRQEQSRVDLYGDPLPRGAVARLGTVRFRHGGEIRAIAFSPDGKTIATGGWYSRVRLWAARTGKQLHELKTAAQLVGGMSFSANGKKLIVISSSEDRDSQFQIWEVATGSLLYEGKLPGIDGRDSSWAFSPKGVSLALRGDFPTILDVANQQMVREFRCDGERDSAGTVAFSIDGTLLASGGSKKIRIWDVDTGELQHEFNGKKFIRHLAFSSNKKQLLVVEGKQIRTLHIESGKTLWIRTYDPNWISSLAVSARSGILGCVLGNNTYGIIDFESGKELARTADVPDYARAAFSYDGQALVVGAVGAVRFWRFGQDQKFRTAPGHTHSISHGSFSSDGRFILSADRKGIVRRWDAATGTELQVQEFPFQVETILANGEFVVGRHDGLQVWNRVHQAEHFRSQNKPLIAYWEKPSLIAASSIVGTTILDLKKGTHIGSHEWLPRLIHAQTSATSPDGNLLAIGGEHLPPVAFKPGEAEPKLKSWPAVQIWNRVTGKESSFLVADAPIVIRPNDNALHGRVRAIAFSPDSKHLACANAGFLEPIGRSDPDRSIRYWDLNTGKQLRQFIGHEAGIVTLDFSPDGELLASGSRDRTIRIWDVKSGEEVQRFQGHLGAVTSVAFSPDGKRLLSASTDSTMQ